MSEGTFCRVVVHIYIYIYIYIYKGTYGAIHQTKVPFVALDPVRDTIMIGIFI